MPFVRSFFPQLHSKAIGPEEINYFVQCFRQSLIADYTFVHWFWTVETFFINAWNILNFSSRFRFHRFQFLIWKREYQWIQSINFQIDYTVKPTENYCANQSSACIKISNSFKALHVFMSVLLWCNEMLYFVKNDRDTFLINEGICDKLTIWNNFFYEIK